MIQPDMGYYGYFTGSSAPSGTALAKIVKPCSAASLIRFSSFTWPLENQFYHMQHTVLYIILSSQFLPVLSSHYLSIWGKGKRHERKRGKGEEEGKEGGKGPERQRKGRGHEDHEEDKEVIITRANILTSKCPTKTLKKNLRYVFDISLTTNTHTYIYAESTGVFR